MNLRQLQLQKQQAKDHNQEGNLIMDFFKRIGTDRHKFKVQFFLKTLSCNTRQLKGDIIVSIKRGEHKISSQNKVSLGEDGACDFGKQILCFQSLTLFYDSSQKKYQEKQGQVRVIIITKKGQKKLLGSFQIDIAEYANSGKENLQYKKQFGEKIKVMMEFDVFIKCLGEASQTSKSVDKQIQPRKQSSLSKFTSFFTGHKQQSPESKKKPQNNSDSQDSNKRVRQEKKKQKNQTKNSNLKGESQKVFSNKYNLKTDNKKLDQIQIANQVNDNKKGNLGSEKKINDKNRMKPNYDEDELDVSPKQQKTNKNLVNVKQKDNFTEIQQSQDQPRKKIVKQQPIFFDRPASLNKKKNPSDDEEKEVQQRPNRMKRTQHTTIAKQSNDKKQVEKEKDISNKTKNISQFQINSVKIDTQKLQKLQKSLKQYKQKNSLLQKQVKKLGNENENLTNENVGLKQKIKNFTNSREFYETQRQPTNKKGDDEKVRSLQKQKGQLLVKIQKLQQKYKKDFGKYQQTVEQYEEQKKQIQEASKAEIKRLKQQFSEQKQKLDKVMNKLQEKTKQAKQSKQKQNDLKERLAMAQSNLSQLKLKIGDKLNEANQQGNRSVIDILTVLSQ